MKYFPPYSLVKQKIRLAGPPGKQRLDMRHEDFVQYVRHFLNCIQVDEAWYLAHNADVAEAIKSGKYRNASHHFVEEGYFEGRLPYEIAVDEKWYAATYPDVASGLKEGTLGSATEHFRDHGFAEGRLPCES